MPDWTPEEIAELTRLWNQKDPVLSTSEIGRRMGISKNAAVAKAHRLNLEPRPSPIRRHGPRPDSQKFKMGRARQQPSAPRPKPKPVSIPDGAAKAPNLSRVEQYAALGVSNKRCSWPIGHPGDPDFRICTEMAVNTKPFCAEHCAVAYAGVPKTKTEAA